jgi:hypothetical protein
MKKREKCTSDNSKITTQDKRYSQAKDGDVSEVRGYPEGQKRPGDGHKGTTGEKVEDVLHPPRTAAIHVCSWERRKRKSVVPSQKNVVEAMVSASGPG